MEHPSHRLTRNEIAHVIGRMVLAVLIGWGYLASVIALDIGGWGTWLERSQFGPLVRAQLVAVIAVSYGAVGAHVGVCNVMASTVRLQRAKLAERRAALRQWKRF